MNIRHFLGVLLAALPCLRSGAATELVFIGRGDEGIHVARLDTATGALTDQRKVASVASPSFLAISPNHRFLYAVSEGQTPDGSAINAYTIAPDGSLTFINRQPSGGSGPCHVSLDPQGKWLFAANYGSGSMIEYSVKADGSLGERAEFIQNHGSGPNRERQEGPHAHCVSIDPTGQYVYDCDLGLDEVLAYKLDGQTGALQSCDPPFYKSQPGSGPRHLTFHPNGRFAYLLCEMASTLTALDFDAANGKLSAIQTVPLLPADFKGHNISAEVAVHPSGKWVYGSNRGDDSIAVFACDQQSGHLTFVQRISSGGKTPRHIEIDSTGAFLLAANQDSGLVAVFQLDPSTGRLADSGQRLEVPHPECVLCLPADK